MRVPEIEQVLQRLREIGGARLGAGADDRELAEAEALLGMSLPPGYRTLLRSVGWASVADIAVFGLGADVPPDLDLRTVRERIPGLPDRMVPFARDAKGAVYCLDPAHEGPYESPVFRCEPSGEAATYEAHDLASWLWFRLAGGRS